MSIELASIKGTRKEKGKKKPHQRLLPIEVKKDHFCMQFCLICVAFGLSTRVRWIFPNLHKYICTLTHTLSFQNPRLWPLLSHSPSSSWQPARGMVRAGWKTWSLLQTNYSNLIRSLYSLLSKLNHLPSSVVYSHYKKYMCISSW